MRAETDLRLSRRRFLVGTALVSSATVSGCVSLPDDEETPDKKWPTFAIARPEDRLYLEVEAQGFRYRRSLGQTSLVRTESGAVLVFTFPSQHFAETTIQVQVAKSCNKDRFEDALNKIKLFPSARSRVVFAVPPDTKRINLTASDLLDWSKFSLVLTDLDALESRLASNGRRYFLGLDWNSRTTTAIELPWGIYLQPLGKEGQDFTWRHSREPLTRSGRHELWITLLESSHGRQLPVPFEILDTRGLSYGGFDPPTLTALYADSDGYEPDLNQSPIDNLARLELAASLSRRFPYPPRNEPLPALVYDDGSQAPETRHPCYVPPRSLEVSTYGLSSFGGWLDLRGGWVPRPGCDLQSWTHATSFGRDHLVKLELKGWLYPLGIPAVFIVISEREFIRDKDDHFVAPLVQRGFIRVPQPNEINVSHKETPFTSISVTTTITGPLDPPPSDPPDVDQLRRSDYFVPQVGGVPVEFEISCIDHSGAIHLSRMPVYFVFNRTLRQDGLIPEPGHQGAALRSSLEQELRTAPQVQCDDRIPRNNTGRDFSTVDQDAKKGGLWDLDSEWQRLPYRFAQYGGTPVSVAQESSPGDTTLEVAWVEWVRGEQPPIDDGEAAVPFAPRARLIKLALQTTRQFSGQNTFALASYRNLQFDCFPVLDPEPTDHDRYASNVFDPENDGNQADIYLHILPLPGGGSDGEEPLPTATGARTAARNSTERLQLLRAVYFGNAGELLPLQLFRDLESENRFGFDAASDSLGGLATPDTPLSLISRRFGPIGDNTFDKGAKKERATPPPKGRLDYIEYRNSNRRDNVDAPFDDSTSFDPATCDTTSVSRSVLSAIDATLAEVPPVGAFTSVASMFGIDAEILPGIRLVKVLELANIGFELQSSGATATPLVWQYKVKGLEELRSIVGNEPGQLSVRDLGTLLEAQSSVEEDTDPLVFGVEASLQWSTNSLNDVDLGIIRFSPQSLSGKKSLFSVSARASVDLLGGNPAIDGRAELQPFTLTILDSLDVEFIRVRFSLDSEGNKEIDPTIGLVQFRNALAFIDNLQRLLKDLTDDIGVEVVVEPRRIEISQRIAIPPSGPDEVRMPYPVGPALIENLYFRWGLAIPLIDRSAMLFFFALASRDDPFIITVPPYGGKAHALIEATSKGMRLFEVSMEYGGILRAQFSIAEGEVSLTAGFFFLVSNQGNTEALVFEAFAKLVGTLDVARVITFNGLLQVKLRYASGRSDKLTGQVTAKVSMKIGFARVSYSFTAEHEEEQSGQGQQSGSVDSLSTSISAQKESASSSAVSGTPAQDSSCRARNFDGLAKPLFDAIGAQEWAKFVSSYAY